MASRRRLDVEDWFLAVLQQDHAIIDTWVSTMARSTDEYKETALMKAVRAKDLQMTSFLAPYEFGATNDKGYTALMIAAIANLGDFCGVLASYEANVNLTDGRTALMIAASLSANNAVQALAPLQSGQRDANGMTALMYAVVYGSVDTARSLLLYEKRILTSENKTALIIAAEHYRKDMIYLLYPHEHGLLPEAESIALAPYRQVLIRHRETANTLNQTPLCSARPCPSGTISLPKQNYSNVYLVKENSTDDSLVSKDMTVASTVSQDEFLTPRGTRTVRISLPASIEAVFPKERSVSSSPHVYRSAPMPHVASMEEWPKKRIPITTRHVKQLEPKKTVREQSPLSKEPRSRTPKRLSIGFQGGDKRSMQKPRKRCTNARTSFRTASNHVHPVTVSSSRTEEQDTLAAMKRYILVLERKLLDTERRERTLIDQNEESFELISKFKQQLKQQECKITFTQCAIQTDDTPEIPKNNVTEVDLIEQMQSKKYIRQIHNDLSLLTEEISSLCNTIQQEADVETMLENYYPTVANFD